MKPDAQKTRQELLAELNEVRVRFAALETWEATRQQMEQKLVVSEVRYRRLFETAQDGILILDAETGQITDANPYLTSILGYSKEELLDKTLWEIGLLKDVAPNRTAFLELQDRGYIRYEDLPLKTRDGRAIEVEFVSNVYAINGSKVIQCNIRDITKRKQAERNLQVSEERFRTLYDESPIGIELYDAEGKLVIANKACLEIFGASLEQVKGFKLFEDPNVTDEIKRRLRKGESARWETPFDFELVKKHKLYQTQRTGIISLDIVITPLAPIHGHLTGYLAQLQDISIRKQSEETLVNALEELRRRSQENLALLAASRVVLKYKKFKSAARSIFDSCRNLIGATAGYIALMSKDRQQNEVLFLESGGRSCDVDPALSMPIRGLRGEVYRTGEAAFHNDFAKSTWAGFLPPKHVAIDNVLFAPLVIEKSIVGLLGLANKPGGFSQNDAEIATAFARLVAIALQNSRMLEALENSEKLLRREHKALVKAKDELETRVLERTAELEKMAEDLKAEVAERRHAEYEMRILAKRLVEVQEEERRTIARELHDETGQTLTILKLLVNKAMKSQPEEALSSMSEALQVADEVIQQVRSLSLNLRPTMLDDLGLLPALKWLIQQYVLKTKIEVEFKHIGIKSTFTPEINITAYRIIQEALTNVARYAGVDRVCVSANTRRGNLYLRIADRGRGFDPNALTAGTSTGLSSMRERCRSLNGELTVKSRPGSGTTIACRLPLGPDKH